ncbi:phage shock protein PspC (stress-responsive transcriptional regulator) [Rhodococcus erythropolis]|uniref:PspC domain-containing protein n=1 Tax=Rhodococcus TaxID=1827 RepID=UPI00216AAF4B|nr:PspC domain-containing protein [Rhodococcus erythropolis]MCS4254376.1 phage shock protein PspC (stress-responsive transcriptional regulator) [Rhodococcus erythropolis]MCW2429644.1 phage shock protein PspC (stress-responsive transcriptional regulator) [Rhodococcus erythropolis]
MNNPTFQEQIQDLWRTRPVRLPAQGHVAGVCAGIGYRYGIDPVLVRVAFVASTIFGGSGILLYLAGWLVLARAGDGSSPAQSLMGRGHSSDSSTKTIVLLVALAIAATTVGPVGVGLGGSGLIGLILMVGGLWLLYQRAPIPPALPQNTSPYVGAGTAYPGTGFTPGPFTPGYFAPNQPPVYTPYTKLPDSYVPEERPADQPQQSPQSQAAHPTINLSKDPSASVSTNPTEVIGEAAITPPSWDPLGVAPFAWDLPDPAAKATPLLPLPPRKRRSRWTLTVLGLAIIVAAVTGAAGAATGNEWFTPGRVGAVGLAVIALGLILGAFFRKGYGLLVVTGPLVGFVLLASLVYPIEFDASGEQRWTPATASELEPSYSGAFGSFTLDLNGVKFTEDETIDVAASFGEFTVMVPPTVNVKNSCTVVMGDGSGCLDGGIHPGRDATPDSPTLTINAKATFGSLKVTQS